VKTAIYIALCLIAPVIWGVISAKLFDLFEARRKALRGNQPPEQHRGAHWDMYEI
jgi:hypothetical protein